MIEKKKSRLVKFYIIAVIILLIFLHYLKVLKTVEDYTLNNLFNSQGQVYDFLTKLKYSFINYQEAQELKKSNTELLHKYNQVLYDNTQLIAYKQENESLRNILKFQEDKGYHQVLARVIGRDMDRINTLVVNQGKNSGFQVGYPVVVDNGIIIGKIIDVKDNLSTVLFLTDKLSQLAVSTNSGNETIGLAKGEYGLSIKIEFIPQDLFLQQEDLIITSGLEQNIPRGLIAGSVNRIISNENDLFKTVSITPAVNFEQILIVSVLIPN